MNIGHLIGVRLETAAAIAIRSAADAAAVRDAIRAELRAIASELRAGDWIELPGGATCRAEFVPAREEAGR
jgi:hypothetical protein